ncbi:MAG TPA: hypothetical protein VKU85_01275 [bacterium]|nr:hypothetical protein [bacterium]
MNRALRAPARSIVLPLLLLLTATLGTPPAGAGVPDPDTSSYGVSGAGAPCQFRFRADGGLDELVVQVTVRHTFGHPIQNVPISITLNPAPGAAAFCACCELRHDDWSDSVGVVTAAFSRLGGRGSLTVDVTSHWADPPVPFFSIPVDFTSPDLNGSCDPAPASAATIEDLGIWAMGGQAADYDCSGAADLLDLGLWAGGLGVACDPGGCP